MYSTEDAVTPPADERVQHIQRKKLKKVHSTLTSPKKGISLSEKLGSSIYASCLGAHPRANVVSIQSDDA